MAKNKFYAVKSGYKTGIFDNWDDAKVNVSGFSGAKYKSFKTIEEAELFMKDDISEIKKEVKNDDIELKSNELNIFTDGTIRYESDNSSIVGVGYGFVAVINDRVVYEKSGHSDRNDVNNKYRNVYGEINGVIEAIKYAEENGYSKVNLYIDYEGLILWVEDYNGRTKWKSKNDMTKSYKELIESKRKTMDITFHKVVAHSGVKYNEMADKLSAKSFD